MRILTSVFLLFLICGCASSSGVLKSGPDTFTVNTSASSGRGGTAPAKKSAYDQANQECAQQNKTIQVISEKISTPSWTDSMHTVDLTFKCQ